MLRVSGEKVQDLDKRQLVVVIVVYILWSALIPLVNVSEIRVLGVPLFWFYYIVLSISTALTLTVMYLLER